jgi:aryl-alcohol dehydrogenase-like predicted oxidoreductase
VYSWGLAEEILGEALEGRRREVLLSTKASFPMGSGPHERGGSRQHLLEACESSLRRLRTDYIDLYHMHGFDAVTPVEETMRALEDLVRSGKVRYIACSNFSGWHLMKSLAVADARGWTRYVGHQAYYSLLGREYEWELMPLARDQGIGTIVWSPLAGGALTGKIRRERPAPASSRLGKIDFIPYDADDLHTIVDALETVAEECGKTIPQVAINWLLQRPTVTSIILGARDEEQLRQNLGAVGWQLTAEQVARLDRASERSPTYPYLHQRNFPELIPPLVPSPAAP